MAVFFTVLIITFGVLYFFSKDKYADIVCLLDKNEFPLKGLLPVGMFILDAFKRSYNTGYDRKLAMAVAELYGHRKVLLMLRVHWGSKISLVLLALLFAGFVGIFTDVDGGYLFSAPCCRQPSLCSVTVNCLKRSEKGAGLFSLSSRTS